MKTFNSLFNVKTTCVLVEGDPDKVMRKAKEIDANRKTIKVDGLAGSFQRGHVLKFSNKL